MKKISKSERDKNYGFRLIVGVVILILLGLSVIIYLAIHTVNQESQEEQKFDSLKSTVSLMQKRFQDDSLAVSWSNPVEKCIYYSGTGLAKGGWSCGSSFGSTMSNTNIEDHLTRFRQIIQESKDDLSNYKESELKSQISGATHTIFVTDKKTSIPCQLYFSKINADLNIIFECKSGAQKSWYSNDEPSHSTVPGKEAWKD